MSEETVLEVAQNADGAWAVSVVTDDAAGLPVAYAPADSLEAVVYAGDGALGVLTLGWAWVDAAFGAARLTCSAAQSAALPAGVYPVEVTVVIAATGQRVRGLDAWFQVSASPGTAAALPVYCSYADMTDFGGGDWLDSLRRKGGLANFARERARARTWLDDLVTKKFRPWSARGVGYGYTTSGALDARNATVKAHLAANRLIVTDQIKEVAALKALELVCRQRVTFGPKDEFPARAERFRNYCRNRVLCTTAEVDTNGDGVADFALALGLTSTR